MLKHSRIFQTAFLAVFMTCIATTFTAADRNSDLIPEPGNDPTQTPIGPGGNGAPDPWPINVEIESDVIFAVTWTTSTHEYMSFNRELSGNYTAVNIPGVTWKPNVFGSPRVRIHHTGAQVESYEVRWRMSDQDEWNVTVLNSGENAFLTFHSWTQLQILSSPTI